MFLFCLRQHTERNVSEIHAATNDEGPVAFAGFDGHQSVLLKLLVGSGVIGGLVRARIGWLTMWVGSYP
jgi:hypothetical protein